MAHERIVHDNTKQRASYFATAFVELSKWSIIEKGWARDGDPEAIRALNYLRQAMSSIEAAKARPLEEVLNEGEPVNA